MLAILTLLAAAAMVLVFRGPTQDVRIAALRSEPAAEVRLMQSLNAERTAKGRPALKAHAELVEQARIWAQAMAHAGTIRHSDLLARIEGRWLALGENVGMGPFEANDGPGGETGDELIHAAFMSSPGHRSSILDRDYTVAGVGAFREGDTIYVAEMFGRPAPKPEPSPSARCDCP